MCGSELRDEKNRSNEGVFSSESRYFLRANREVLLDKPTCSVDNWLIGLGSLTELEFQWELS